MIQIELSEAQAKDMHELLSSHTRELLGQIDRAFDREFKRTLKERYDRLEPLRLQLLHQLDRGEAYA